MLSGKCSSAMFFIRLNYIVNVLRLNSLLYKASVLSNLVFYVLCLVLYLNPERLRCTISDIRDFEWMYIFLDSSVPKI